MIFDIKFIMNEKGLTTFFQHKLFTIPKNIHKHWNYPMIHKQSLSVDFNFSIAATVLEKFRNDTDIQTLLNDMNQLEAIFTIKNNNGKRYSSTNQFIKCVMPYSILMSLKKLFVSTLVYHAENKIIPELESITFTFDTKKREVVVTDLVLFQPNDNPFYKYAKNCVSTLSVEAIGLEEYSQSDDNKVKNFYDQKKMTPWTEVSKLEDDFTSLTLSGVYMLYNIDTNQFYVGKAKKIKERIKQHQTPHDSMYGFTHYRYSAISGEYLEFLYLIENAAIHDCAWLLNMPRAKKYKLALAEKIKTSGVALNDCKMVNKVEQQTRKEKID